MSGQIGSFASLPAAESKPLKTRKDITDVYFQRISIKIGKISLFLATLPWSRYHRKKNGYQSTIFLAPFWASG
jgi:hypothetical protein